MSIQTIYKVVKPKLTVVDGERAVLAVISAGCMDRDQEVLLPKGCDASDYLKNPVVLMGHDAGLMPIGKCVAIERTDDAVMAKTVFATRPEGHEGEWLPDTVFSLFQQGVMRAFSVGFMPMEHREPTPKDMERFGGACRRVFSKWKLLEYSVVTIPANQDSVAMAVSKGLLTAERAKTWFAAVDATADPAPAPAVDAAPASPTAPAKPTKRVTIFIPCKAPVAPAAPAGPRSISDLVADEFARQKARRKGQLFY